MYQNRLLRLIFIGIFLSFFCEAQSVKQRVLSASTPVTLSCVRAASGGSNRITWQTDYGSSSREITRTITYTCSVRWFGKQPTNALLEVWYVGVPGEGGGGKEMILDNQTVPIWLDCGTVTTTNITSSEIGNDKATYAALGERDVSGAQLRGCVIQLIMGDNVIRTYSSQAHLQKASWVYPFGSLEDGKIGP